MIGLTYLGAFRLPRHDGNGQYFDFGGGAQAYNPTNHTLFTSNRQSMVAEVTIPEPVNSTNIADLPFAAVVQPLADPFGGTLSSVAEDASISGLMVFDGELYATACSYYDANNAQQKGHIRRSLNLSDPSIIWQTVYRSDRQGFVAGYMAPVPSEWRARFNCEAITGQAGLPIVSRGSSGPAVFGFYPREIAGARVGDVVPLAYYPMDKPLGTFLGSSDTWGGTSTIGGVVMPSGLDRTLFFGANGIGPFGYGPGTSDRSLAGLPVPDAPDERYCYDPLSSDKGQHAYPYRYQVWSYVNADLLQVAQGQVEPWTVRPTVHALELPIIQQQRLYPLPMRLGDASYDDTHRRIYVSEMQGDADGYGNRALIHVFAVDGTTPAPEPLPPIVTPPDDRDAKIAGLEATVAFLEQKVDAQLVQISAIKTALQAIVARLSKLKGSQQWLIEALKGVIAK